MLIVVAEVQILNHEIDATSLWHLLAFSLGCLHTFYQLCNFAWLSHMGINTSWCYRRNESLCKSGFHIEVPDVL